MKYKIISHILLLVIVIINTGCAVRKIHPEPKECSHSENYLINSYTHTVESPYVNMNNKRDFTVNVYSKTKKTLIHSTLLETIPNLKQDNSSDTFHLDIFAKYQGHGGAGGQEFLTGLSLGLIPSWGTRKNLYEYKFKLYKNGQLYKTSDYHIDEDFYAHLILLPYGLWDTYFVFTDGMHYEPIELYDLALHTMIKKCSNENEMELVMQRPNKYEERNTNPQAD